MPRRRNRETEPYPTIAQARAAAGPDNPFAAFESPLATVLEDPEGVAALVREEGQSWLDAAVMLDRIGFQLWLEGMVVDDGQTYGRWKVRVPDYIADEVALVIWQWKPSESRPRTLDQISFMLHKSTRHDGWQLTSFSADNQPWGHSEIYAFDDAFKTGPMDSGQSAGNVVQVVMKDGTVHTLPGRSPLVANPETAFSKLKRRLMR